MRRVAWLSGRPGRRGSAAPLAVGLLGLGAIATAVWLLRPATTAAPAAAVPPVAAVPAPTPPVVAPVTAATPIVAEVAAASAVEEVTLTADERLTQHLAAGEFGPALELAATVADPAERHNLIRRVADAQAAAGEFEAALATLRKLPAGAERRAAAADLSREASLAGGSGADFTQLIQLIQNETGNEDYGPWLDIHGSGGTLTQFDSGVRVDPHGVLALVTARDQQGRLTAASQKARTASLNEDMARPSELRMVSLTRLERAISDRLAAGKPVVESMRQLAGLTEIQYVFVFPESGEIVLAGPADGWQYNEQGRAVSAATGRPTLQLDDLVTLLRTFSPTGMNIFGCSIDPRAENLQALKEFVAESQARGPLVNGQAGRWAKQLQEKLGMQDVTVYGVPADSRVARVIVEADYRMKLIGIGKLDGGSQIPSYFKLLADHPEQASGRIDGLRWWMTLQAQRVLTSESRDAFEIQGSSVLCQSENEFLDRQGQRVHTGDAEPTNRLFASNFTRNFDDLARREPIFADLEGVFDLALVAALIRHDGLDQRAGWDRGAFAPGGAYLTAAFPVPKEVETVVNHRVFNGKDVIVQVAGGVKGDVMALLNNSELRATNAKMSTVAEQSRPQQLPEGRWWWDAN